MKTMQLTLDYPVNSRRRWDEQNPHRALYDIIDANRAVYESHLQGFLKLSSHFAAIPKQPPAATESSEPHWNNGWLPALDGVALYGFIVANKPKLYLEVGSGNSTKFARKAIVDHGLDTVVVSIDPCPRAEIDKLCDVVVRQPVEDVDLELFDRLGANDILFVDNSHRVFMNSDATTVFLDVLPRLKSGVLVEFHDITLPYDYPESWIERYYSEQYLLAAYLLAKGTLFDIVLPNVHISHDAELRSVLAPLWGKDELQGIETQGGSFWLRMS